MDHSEAKQMLERLLVADGETPSGALAAREQADSVQSALARLPREYEAVLRGLLFGGFDYHDMAQRLGRSSDAVRLLCVRAIKRLRREIEEHP
jgi:RNA polymerase sigma-70 factor, ECF subfamily